MLDLLSRFRKMGCDVMPIRDRISNDDVVMICSGICVCDGVACLNHHHPGDIVTLDSVIRAVDGELRKCASTTTAAFRINKDALRHLSCLTNDAIEAADVELVTAIAHLVSRFTEVVE